MPKEKPVPEAAAVEFVKLKPGAGAAAVVFCAPKAKPEGCPKLNPPLMFFL